MEALLRKGKAWSLCEAILAHSNNVNSTVFSPDSVHIVTASSDETADLKFSHRRI